VSETESLSDLVAFVARALVDKPDEVLVEEVPTPRGVVLELSVAEDDIGKVIGKDGRTAQAIRTVLSAASAKSGRRVQLDIVDLPRLFVTSRDDVPSCEADPARRGRTPPRRAR